jgi:hypothetical protein
LEKKLATLTQITATWAEKNDRRFGFKEQRQFLIIPLTPDRLVKNIFWFIISEVEVGNSPF